MEIESKSPVSLPSIAKPTERTNVVPFELVPLCKLLADYKGRWDSAELLNKRNAELGIDQIDHLPLSIMEKEEKIVHHMDMLSSSKKLLNAMYDANVRIYKVVSDGVIYIVDGETQNIQAFPTAEFSVAGIDALNELAYRKFPRLCRNNLSPTARLKKSNIKMITVADIDQVDANPLRTDMVYHQGADGVSKKVLNILDNNARPVTNKTVTSTESDEIIAGIIFQSMEATTQHIAEDNTTDGNVGKMLKYIRGGIASMVRVKHKRSPWAFIFQGKQGTGKSGLANLLATLVGVSSEVNASALYDSFDQGTVRKLLIHVVEAFIRTPEQAEVIKGLIDGATQVLNEKYVKAVNVLNYTKYVFTLNGWADIIHGLGEARRFFMLNVNPFKGNPIDTTVPITISEARFNTLCAYKVPVMVEDEWGHKVASADEDTIFTRKAHHVVDVDGNVTISSGELIPITGEPSSAHMGIMKLVVGKVDAWHDETIELGNPKVRPVTKGIVDARSEVLATVELTQNVRKVAQGLKESNGIGNGRLSKDYIDLNLIMNDKDGKKNLSTARHALLTSGVVINDVLYTLHNFNDMTYMLPISVEERQEMSEVAYQDYLIEVTELIASDALKESAENTDSTKVNDNFRAYLENVHGATYDNLGNLIDIEKYSALDVSGFTGKLTNKFAMSFNKVNSGYSIQRPFPKDGTIKLLARTANVQAKLYTEDF